MPPHTSTIRRCTFKLPRNDKYQCQRAANNHQIHIGLWYCRFHDGHAKDRCQVLIEWAGKGAQCEHLGVLDGSGRRLCELHATKAEEDERSCVQNELAAEEGGEEEDLCCTVEAEAVEKQDFSRIEAPKMAPGEAATGKTQPPKHQDTHLSGISLTGPTPTAFPDPTTTPRPTLHDHKTSPTTPPNETPNNPTTIRTPHKRTDSFDPLTTKPPSSKLPFLPAQAPLQANRTAALYKQCCICLEPHSAEHMQVVGACGHVYRALCVVRMKKVGEGGGIGGMGRRYNCGVCRGWVEGLRESMC